MRMAQQSTWIRTWMWMATMSLVLATGGCIFGQQPGSSDNPSESDGVDVSVDGGVDGASNCENWKWYPDSDEDGFGRQGAEAVGVGCEPPEEVESAARNTDDCDDTAPDINPDGSEGECNGVDDDCDGTVDEAEEIESQTCPNKQAGVCDGATTSQCTDGGEYAQCGDEQFPDAYIDANDEGWRCNGTDDDCDGEIDEACCGGEDGSSGPPELVSVDPNDANQETPVIVPAVEGASDGASHLVVWSNDGGLYFQEISAEGDTDGLESYGVEFEEETQVKFGGLAVTSVENTYLAAVVLERESADTLKIVRVNAGSSGSVEQVESVAVSSAGIGPAALVVQEDTAWMVYSIGVSGGTWVVNAASLDLSGQNIEAEPFPISGETFGHPTFPAVALVDGTPTAVWQQVADNSIEATIHGARIDGENREGSGRFQVDTKVNELDSPQPVDFVSTGDAGALLYPDFNMGGALRMLEVGADATGDIGEDATSIVPGDPENMLPSAMPVDRDGDGEVDNLSAVWMKGDSNDPDIVTGRVPVGEEPPENIDTHLVAEKGSGASWFFPTVSTREGRAGAVFSNTDPSDHELNFAPLSIDGAPICR